MQKAEKVFDKINVDIIKMNKKIAVKSSIIGVASKLLISLLTLVYSKVFLAYIGVEIKGLNEVLTNCVGLLNLTELGIGSAIIYALYGPLVEDDNEEIIALMQLYKKLYQSIGIAIMVIGSFAAAFLPVLLKETNLSWAYVRFVFEIQLIASASTYFLAYKRNLLYADKKMYITILTDTFCQISVRIIQIILIIYTASYPLVLLVGVTGTILSNVYINGRCNRWYPFLCTKKVYKYTKIDELRRNIKDIMIGRIGGFVYSSTDNLIISAVLGVVEVGFMSNYYQIKSFVNVVSSSITEPIMPIIGNILHEERKVEEHFQLFLSYTFIRYCLANYVCVGVLTIIGPFVSWFYGEQFVLAFSIPILMILDLYISIVHGPCGEFINALGLFKDDRNMSLIGMLINLGTSLICVFFWGTSGVLIGTVLTQLYYWTARCYIVFKQFFCRGAGKYCVNIFIYTIAGVCDVIILQYISSQLLMFSGVIKIIFLLIASIGISTFTILCFYGTNEFSYLFEIIKILLAKKMGEHENG